MSGCISLSIHRKLHAFCNTCRNVNRYDFLIPDNSFTITVCTFLHNNLTFTSTSRASGLCLHLSQNGIGNSCYNTRAFARITSLCSVISFCTGAMTMRTSYVFLYLDFLFYSCSNIFQGKFNLNTQIRTPIYPTATTLSAKATKATKTTEMTSKNISELWENIFHRHSSTETSRLRCTTNSRMTKLIITLTFLRIAQHIIGLSRFFKLFFSFFIPRIFIRVILNCFFTISLLYFFFRCIFVYTQHFVIISLRHFGKLLLFSYDNFCVTNHFFI